MSGAVDGAIGGAVSAVVAPVVRDALYDGTETITTGTNAAGSPVQITSYNNANLNAATTAIAALAGGGAAGILGRNATAGVTWAANEAINNSLGTEYTIGAVDSTKTVSSDQQTSGSNTEANTFDKAGKAALDNSGIQLTPGSIDASSDGSSSQPVVASPQTTASATGTSGPSTTGTGGSNGSSSSGGSSTAAVPITFGDQSSAFAAQVSQTASNMYYLGQAGVQETAALADQFLVMPFAFVGGTLGGVATTIANGTFGTQQGVQQAIQSAFDTANLYSYQPSNALAQSNLATIDAAVGGAASSLMPALPILGDAASYLQAAAEYTANLKSATVAAQIPETVPVATESAVNTNDASVGGNSANINEMAGEANSINEKIVQNGQIIGDQPYVAPTNTTGGFQTHGITVDQVPMSIQNQLESDLQAGGASDPTASMQQIIQSGSTVPVPIQATPNTTLYKLVSTTSDYSTPSPTTAFWVDQAQLNLIQAHPELANDILGLPANSQAASFNVFEIQPKPNTTPTIYQSQVATTTEASGDISVGNATQTIVPNRSLWTTPQPTGITIKVN